MLAQFKDKVSENLDSSDVRAHSDLGTAYKEMGLLDEAIASFQAALRASADHLPTYELMGQTFMEMGQPEAAVKSLERAIEVATTVEDELVGIYYYLGRASRGTREPGVGGGLLRPRVFAGHQFRRRVRATSGTSLERGEHERCRHPARMGSGERDRDGSRDTTEALWDFRPRFV